MRCQQVGEVEAEDGRQSAERLVAGRRYLAALNLGEPALTSADHLRQGFLRQAGRQPRFADDIAEGRFGGG